MAKKRKKKLKSDNDLATPENVLLTMPPEEKKKVNPLLSASDAEMRVRLERELRRYVKRAGGLRKGLEDNKKVKDTVRRLCKALDRDCGSLSKVRWDQEIHVPGYDNPTVRDLTGVM